MARHVVARASLSPAQRVLDVGTGTGTAAALARGEGRRVVGLDAAPGMLAIARAEVPDVEFVDASFDAIPFPDDAFDAVIAVHALLFADDPVAALREWRRVCAPGGRLSMSVPGPGDVVPMSIFGAIFDRYGIGWGTDYPTL
ncbi:MAG TPA: class I SAM-dependent methyltransferase, partial [Candidatus Limnocylindrales bacterium]|nr:class I SAM-dependent methyltransferase [Candidatus Limnocylindrales bacterium]